MIDLGYIVEKFDGKSDYTLHLWKLVQSPSEAIWKAPVKKDPSNANEKAVSDYPKVFLSNNCHIYMVIYSGAINTLDAKTGQILSRHGPRKTLIGDKAQRTPIRRLVSFEGMVYDSSYGGLYETDSDKRIDDRQIGSAEVYDGRLLIVPHGANPKQLKGRDYQSPRKFQHAGRNVACFAPDLYRFQDSVRESKAGNLIDAVSKEIVMDGVEPFDGSGCSPGRHFTFAGKVYMHHGDYPGERITIREFPSGNAVNIVPLITTLGFVEHEGTVYDVRDCPHPNGESGARIHRILRSDERDERAHGSLFDLPKDEMLAGIVSGGVDGMLIALFNKEQNRSRIVSHLNQDKPLLEYEGRLFLSRL